MLLGDPAVREALESGADLRTLERSWRGEIETFRKESLPVRLYRWRWSVVLRALSNATNLLAGDTAAAPTSVPARLAAKPGPTSSRPYGAEPRV